jgi:hypothetical protein
MMHFVKDVKYLSEYKLLLTFEDGSLRQVDLAPHLDGEVFEPLKDMSNFKSVHLNSDLDTIVWKNGADMSPDFLYEIGVPQAESHLIQPAAAAQHVAPRAQLLVDLKV